MATGACTAGLTVLLAERCDAVSTLREQLENDGCRVRRAASTAVVVDMLAAERPDVLVVHVALLDGDARESLRRIRAVAPAMPIIIRTSGRDQASRVALIRREVNAVFDEAGDPTHLLDLIACAATTAQAVERLRAEQEVRCLTLAKLCHNLRSPLHVIQGYTEVLREDPAAQGFDDILERVGCATEAAIRQLHEYLTRVRFEVADPVVRREPVNVDQLVAELQTRAAQQIGTRGVRLATRVQFCGACIQTDRDKLRGILLELLSNAIKFTPMGTVTLDVRTADERTAFVVTDQGPGINEPELAALFNPFRQRPDEVIASLPGQGIGLAIARRLSALIGADLAVERGGDGGAVFTLTVPAPMFIEAASVASGALH